jgi:outer membrane lipopolysaccharide assembly protein LptE/RlpB
MRKSAAHMRKMLPFAMVLGLIVVLAACNYRFGGYREGYEEIASLSIPPFENRTRQVGIEALFTNDLVYEVERGDRIALTDRGSADAVVKGVIKELQTNTIARENISTALERRVFVTVELTVKDRRGRKVWEQSIRENEAYFVEPDKVSSEGSLREALEAISLRIAEKFHYRFTQRF